MVSDPSDSGQNRQVALTELSFRVIENLLVEQDDTGTQSDPDTDKELDSTAAPGRSRQKHIHIPHVDRRVEGSLGRLGLLSSRVHGGQGRLRTRDLAGGSGLFSFGTHFLECASLV